MKSTRVKNLALAVTILSIGAQFATSNAHAFIALVTADPVFAGAGASLILGNASLCKSFKFWNFGSCGGVDDPGDIAFAGYLLLDRKVTEIPPLPKADLMDNGFSEIQADRVIEDARRFREKLSSEKKAIVMSGDEPLESIRGLLAAILPNASEEFLDVFARRFQMAAESNQAQK